MRRSGASPSCVWRYFRACEWVGHTIQEKESMETSGCRGRVMEKIVALEYRV